MENLHNYTMELKESIADSLKSGRFDNILKHLVFASQHPRESDLKEAFEIFTRVQCVDFWGTVKQNYLLSIDKISNQICSNVESQLRDGFEADLCDFKAVMNGVSMFCQTSEFKPPSLFDMIYASQKVLTSKDVSPSVLAIKGLVAKLSELWWTNNEQGAEMLMPQLLTYLVIASLDINAHDTTIKRLYSLRGAFLLLDLEDPSCAYLRSFLLRCFAHPAYLKLREGQKLLAFFLSINQGKH